VPENEAVADAFSADNSEAFEALPAADILTAAHVADASALCAGPYLRLWPHRHQTDGFFAAVWVRRQR
jgi:16S rRNA (cytosine967-C5)-methyltransferase